ncbi:hypothetical protein F2Q70_00039394 [Brassica cretica]|uniref:Uncharacterized protein n=1 Tax=Brassica cretica TaxID=69181 RepID=A0A8S9K7E6_BRACR|nr:hypothetical protein F2Q70_00039394 [Brassica cretica]
MAGNREFGSLRSSGDSIEGDRAEHAFGRCVTILFELLSDDSRFFCKERDKIGAAPYDGCLRTLVEGIKPFVVRLGVKVRMTSFPARPLRSGFYVEVIRRVAADGILYGLCKLAGFLKTLEYWQRDKFWDLVSRFLILCLEMLETSALGLGQDLGLLLVLEGAMTNSTYVSRFSFILIPYRFKVRDRFSAYTTCMVGTEHLSKDNF